VQDINDTVKYGYREGSKREEKGGKKERKKGGKEELINN
jgi:hypothetical protein